MMKRRKVVWALICLLLFYTAFPVYASGASAVAGFGQGNGLYVFYESEGEAEDVNLLIGGKKLNGPEGRTSPQRMTDSGQRIHYFLLLDLSTSMRKYSKQVNEFVEALLNHTQTPKKTTLLSLGEEFRSEVEGAVDEDEILNYLRNINYGEQKTNLYKEIADAFNYIQMLDRSAGELYQVILLTDGIPYEASETPTLSDVAEEIQAGKDVIFYTLGLGTGWPEEAVEPLCVHFPKEGEEISSLASALAGRNDQLYTLHFELDQPLSGDRMDIKLMFLSGGTPLTMEGIPVLKGSKNEGEETPPEGSLSVTEPEEETADGTPEPTEEETVDETSGPSEEESGETEEPQKEGVPDETAKSRLVIYGLIFLAGVALCAVIFFLFRKKQEPEKVRKPDTGGRREDSGPGGAHLKIEVLSGSCTTRKLEFSLKQELLIGSGQECDLVWEDEDVAEKNSRIFIRDGVVFIEDLDSDCGTAIGGMRIFSPNRLRNGDVVSIGRVHFKVLLG